MLSDDDDDSDEEDEETSKEQSNQRFKNTLRETMSRLVEKQGGGGRVMISIGNGGLSSFRGLDGGVLNKGKDFKGRGKSIISLDDDDDDSDDEDEEGENEVKELAARTLLAVRWLHSVGRLSDSEKRGITGNIIKNVGEGEFSRAEVAYSLLIGTGLPGEPRKMPGKRREGKRGEEKRRENSSSSH